MQALLKSLFPIFILFIVHFLIVFVSNHKQTAPIFGCHNSKIYYQKKTWFFYKQKNVNFDFRSCGPFEWHDTRPKGITLILSVDHLCLLDKRKILNMKKR